MKREELLKHCRYYKGEEECSWNNVKGDTDPETGKYYQDMRMFWWIEESWVRHGGEIDEGAKYYLLLAKKNGHQHVEGIPQNLLSLIHFFWSKEANAQDLERFDKFIRQCYL